MPRRALKLECSEADKSALIAIAKSRTEEVRIAERARIVLACLEGRQNQDVARDFGVSVPTVSKWRKRFARHGLKGLNDAHRSGKPISYGLEFRNRLLTQIEQPPPRGMSHWDGPALAEKLGASVHAIWRVLRKEGKRNDDWLDKYEGRVQFHFTPTSASWINQIEIVFSLLQRRTLSGASFKSKNELREAIEAFIERHNGNAKPFRWRKREVKGSQLRNTIINLCN